MNNAKAPRRTCLAAALTIACLAGGTPSWAGEHEISDHEQARQAVADGRALPLATILDKVVPTLDGQLLGVELESEGFALIYELKVLAPDGRLTEVRVDAATGEILDVGKGSDDARADR